jgi:hypothetical protein
LLRSYSIKIVGSEEEYYVAIHLKKAYRKKRKEKESEERKRKGKKNKTKTKTHIV